MGNNEGERKTTFLVRKIVIRSDHFQNHLANIKLLVKMNGVYKPSRQSKNLGLMDWEVEGVSEKCHKKSY